MIHLLSSEYCYTISEIERECLLRMSVIMQYFCLIASKFLYIKL